MMRMNDAARRLMKRFFARRMLKRWSRPPRPGEERRRERDVLRVFRRAAGRQPVYRELLAAKGVEPSSIRSLSDFTRNAPFVSKEDIFGGGTLHRFFDRGVLADTAVLYTSSGFTARFAFGAQSKRDASCIAFFIEEILLPVCGVRARTLLVVNCLSLGTEIPLARHTQAKTGLRSDSVVEILRRAASEFEGVIIAGEPLFLKRVVEEGTAAGLSWEKMKIWIFTGSEYVSEYWRSYLQSLLTQDPTCPENGGIFITYGLTEFGLAVGFETTPLVLLRRALVAEDEKKRGTERRSRPPFMHYLPDLYRLETSAVSGGASELAVTALDPHRLIPLVRYRTGDEAELYAPGEIGRLLAAHGLCGMPPDFKGLPAVAVHGRRFPVAAGPGCIVSANEIKDALFIDEKTAQCVTGNFRLCPGRSGAECRLLVQLSPGRVPDEATARRIAADCAAYGACGIDVELFRYHDFPFGFEHEFERKAAYNEIVNKCNRSDAGKA